MFYLFLFNLLAGICGSREGWTGVRTPPEKSQKYRVSLQYWSRSLEKSQSYQASIQCWAIIGLPAKCHTAYSGTCIWIFPSSSNPPPPPPPPPHKKKQRCQSWAPADKNFWIWAWQVPVISMYLQAEWITVQLAADLDLHCIKNGIYPGLLNNRYHSQTKI